MIETLTAVFVVLSVLALGLICLVVYLVVGRTTTPTGCPNCGSSRRTVIHDRTGRMSVRCPVCNR